MTKGIRLSGGERQRISLARTFLRDAPILILEEPTSSVDVKTEAGILEALERLMHGRTTFLIAHRASTMKTCDVLVLVEHGRVVSVRSRVQSAFQEAMSTDAGNTAPMVQSYRRGE